MRRILVVIAAAFGFVAPPLAAEEVPVEPAICKACEAALELALADPRRAEDRARDIYRHPAGTLAFFRVEPGMTVVDYMPSGGWYTRILLPYLGKGGHYIGLNPDVSGASEKQQAYFGELSDSFPGKAAAWTGMPANCIGAYNTDGLPSVLDGKVDRVLIFREMHNLLRMGWLDSELGAMRRLLKDEGLLGIVQHRANPDAPDSYVDGSKGYLRQADVIRLVEAQGFELVGTSEINANSADPADHPQGVWMLPPVLSGGHDELKTIGESDRMTLLFRKRN
ncbi:hypothetical protein MB02_14005 [Croceicoccus estronivorus]|uniref:class I SAM-dependent methyltransferase n=1 Tax=Croceicoccus estronivorus TaxID=1172626 RepID=UPI00082BFCB5|nr:class I SAM-dependent methyltransferase [Croceicoccus estronivorus]OCC22883.1 hypothetical protein MB02_14005 [Croceicoccus estronivorus]